MIDIIALYALFGTSIPISKYLLSMAPPVFITAARMLLTGGILMLLQVLRRQSFFELHRQYWFAYAQIIIFGVYLKYILRYWALDYLPATKMAFLLNLGPFITALFSFFLLKEYLTKKQWLGLGIGFLGFVPLLMTTSDKELSIGELFYISWPELAIILAVCAHSYGMIVIRKLLREHKHSAILSNAIRTLGAGILALPTSYLIETQPVSYVFTFSVWLLILVLISNVICHNYHLYLHKRYSATFLSFTDFLGPLFTALYSWLLFSERVTKAYWISVVVVFIGLFLFYQDELKKGSKNDSFFV